MPGGMNEFLWFILGVFSYRIIATFLQYGHMSEVFNRQLEHLIKILAIVSEDLDNVREIKYSMMKDAGVSDEEVKGIREIDDNSYRIWREMTIARIITHWPKLYKRLIKFNSWREAMHYLRESSNKNVAK